MEIFEQSDMTNVTDQVRDVCDKIDQSPTTTTYAASHAVDVTPTSGHRENGRSTPIGMLDIKVQMIY